MRTQAILKAISKLAELTFSAELESNDHYLKVEFSPRNISLWLFNSNIECFYNCYLNHPDQSGISNNEYDIECHRLIERIKAASKEAAEALSIENTEGAK